ncbi:aldo/keto reductase [Bariatricus sp. SGI.161]|uniref:aldo/keto reductase n=1 Tax=Lachnospiraceae TaxID=186803 RepID=UPI002A8B7BA5|nr:aldo/keto reductase [Lachnospiraceae bacterium]MCI6535512.1 aldo/keto reductase [Lachnospiraceae bacterium]MDY4207665.1 aldo/keto reductase [Lachnospiraceae bacterium]
MKSIYDCYELNNGVKIPCVGFGTYKSSDGCGAKGIRLAIESGYRYFDTASFYQNEEYLAEAIRETGVKREELFLASKLWKADMGYHNVKKAFQSSLEKLQTDYLDLYLIHWPLPEAGYQDWKQLDIETWQAMEELYREGRIKAIGVSNFLPHHLENLLQNTQIRPAVDQIEFHPGHTQEMTLDYCQKKGILVQAWSPLGRRRVLEHPLLVELAEKYGVSSAQICIRYAIQRNVIPLPKASSYERMKQNQDVFDFIITSEDMYRIGTMQPTGWSGEHPDCERIYFK